MNITQLIQSALRTLDRNAPVILTSIGVVGVVSTTVLAVRATPEADRRIRLLYDEVFRINSENNGDTEPPIMIGVTKLDIIKVAWPVYIPAAGVGLTTIAAIIGAQSINSRRQAILLSGVTFAERALTEYQDKLIELDGPKKDQKVRDAIVKDHILQQPPSPNELILPAGDVLCYDDYSGRYFHSTMEKIQQAKNEVNSMMINGDEYASLNTFYGQLGLRGTKGGEELGWSTQNLVDINFTSVLTEEGLPCLAMGFRVLPMQDYYRFR